MPFNIFESRIASSDEEIIAEFCDEIRLGREKHIPSTVATEDPKNSADQDANSAGHQFYKDICCNNLLDEVVKINALAAQEATGIGAQAQHEAATKANEEDHVPVVEEDHVPTRANEDDYVPTKANEEDHAPAMYNEEDHGFAKANEEDHVQGGAAEIDEFQLVVRESSPTLANPTDTELQTEMEQLRIDLIPTCSTIQLSTPIEIGDSEWTPRPEDAQNIHPLIEPIPGWKRFPDPGSVQVATK